MVDAPINIRPAGWRIRFGARRIGISSAASDGVDGRQAGVGCGIDFLRCEKLAGNSRRMAPNILQGAGDSSASGAAQRGLTVVRLDYAKHFTNSTCYPQSDSPLRGLVLFYPCCTHTFQLRPCFLFPIRQFLQPAHLLILPGRPWRVASTVTSRGLPRGRAHNLHHTGILLQDAAAGSPSGRISFELRR